MRQKIFAGYPAKSVSGATLALRTKQYRMYKAMYLFAPPDDPLHLVAKGLLQLREVGIELRRWRDYLKQACNKFKV